MKGRSLFAIMAAGTTLAFGMPSPANTAPVRAETGIVAAKIPAGIYELDPTHAALLWSYRHNRISNYIGRFENISGTLKLDPHHISRSSITFTADPSSVQVAYPTDYKKAHPGSPYASWQEELARSPQFLNSDTFPKITFTSTEVSTTSPTTARIIGDLTFLGVTKPITLNATFEGALESHPFMKGPAVGFSAIGTFRRSDFGLSIDLVGDEVTIHFDGEFVQHPENAPEGK